MNKISLFILCLWFLASAFGHQAWGQSRMKPNAFAFGAKAGFQATSVFNKSTVAFSPSLRPAFHIGAMANFHFGYRDEFSAGGTGLFGVQAEVLYSAQGFRSNYGDVSWGCISIPLTARIYPIDHLSIGVGPYFSYLVHITPDAYTVNRTSIRTADLKGSKDWGLSAGVSYQLDLGLVLDVRYNLGLIPMAENLAWKNSVIAVSLGWLF